MVRTDVVEFRSPSQVHAILPPSLFQILLQIFTSAVQTGTGLLHIFLFESKLNFFFLPYLHPLSPRSWKKILKQPCWPSWNRDWTWVRIALVGTESRTFGYCNRMWKRRQIFTAPLSNRNAPLWSIYLNFILG